MCESDFIKIQEKIDSVQVLARIGRLHGKIASALSGFTAEQWMLWVIVYSPFVSVQSCSLHSVQSCTNASNPLKTTIPC